MRSVSLSSDGTITAIGAPKTRSVSLSSDGTITAIGAPKTRSVSLSSDGTITAIGAPKTAESEYSFGEGKNKVSYVGETKTVNGQALAHGIGTFTNENGDTVTGNFIDGRPDPNTESTMAFSDGGTITGFFDGEKGKGTYTDNLGSEIEGEFQFERGPFGGLVPKGNQIGTLIEEVINVNGVTSFANRVGTFVNGYQVAGTVSYEDGRVFVGTCDQFGNPLSGRITDPDGTVSPFVDGVRAVDVPDVAAAAIAAAAAAIVAPPPNILVVKSTLEMKGAKGLYRQARLANPELAAPLSLSSAVPDLSDGKNKKKKLKRLERQKRKQKKLQRKLSKKRKLNKKQQKRLDRLNARFPSLADQAQGLDPVDVATAAAENNANGSGGDGGDGGAGSVGISGGIQMTAEGQAADQGGSPGEGDGGSNNDDSGGGGGGGGS